MADPGMLYVTMQPKPELPAAQFHEWYNNEHGPTRLRIPQIFSNGLRYRATDGKEPTFLAVYDVTSMRLLETDTYLRLRANRSPHEAATIAQVAVKRSFFDLVWERKSPLFAPIEDLTDDEAAGIVLVVNETILHPGEASEAEYRRWYEEEHADMLAKVPGWLRTRFYKTSPLEGSGAATVIMSYTEYARTNGLGGPEHKAAMATKWRDEVMEKHVKEKTRRVYELFYVFGPAPRDLENLAALPASLGGSSTRGLAYDESSRGTPGEQEDNRGAIQSQVTTADGLTIPYRLEGSPDPRAPTVAFCNSLLTSMAMWDPFVRILRRERPDLRILRYDVRGRHAVPRPEPATLDVLARDVRELLRALRIPRLHALVGVSQGGATALNYAIRYPDTLERFVACDFNVASSAANTQAWKDRIALAESDGGRGIEALAAQTVARWFHPASMEREEAVVRPMTDMVAANDVEGFRWGCQALWDYDLKGQMGSVSVPGLLVVGEGDGKGALVKAMEGFKGQVGAGGVELRIVPSTGHLPMWEDAAGFWAAVKDFL